MYNQFTGKKRKRSRYYTPRKKRAETCSTVEERTTAKNAMKQCQKFVEASRFQAGFLSSFVCNTIGQSPQLLDTVIGYIVLSCLAIILNSVIQNLQDAFTCLILDAELLDLDDGVWEAAGYKVPRNRNIRIDKMFESDGICEQSTRFMRDELRYLLDIFGLDEFIPVPQRTYVDTGKFYKFHREELLIYTLHKLSTRKTHKDMADSTAFGGSEVRWGKGYRWMIMYLDERYRHLIGPDGIQIWISKFPYFANAIYDYLKKPKQREEREISWNHQGAATRDEFNIFGFMDCKAYACARLGSGPAHPHENAPRRDDAYYMQLAVFDGHHRQHDIKILTIYLPNGMTAAVYGPVFGRHKDPTTLEWSGFDDALHDAQAAFFDDGRLYSAYADSIFRGYWQCVRTRHEPLPTLGIELPDALENENDCMKSARESIELGYSRPSRLFPHLDEREYAKLGLDAALTYAQVRVAHFLTNVITCLRRGNTCTGDRMFAIAPPQLDDYLDGHP